MKFFIISAVFLLIQQTSACTVTTASGSHAPGSFCSGDIIFEDHFDGLDLSKWKHEVSMFGGYNNEFQWYVNDRANSFVQNGNLHIRPTYTSDLYGEDFLSSGRVVIPPEECTVPDLNGCDRQGDSCKIILPIRSAKIMTTNSFSFKYGTLEIRAKNPAGDWLWPALWMMPNHQVYGYWPRSGEIDLMEARGNRELWSSYPDGGHVGNQQAGQAIHYGPDIHASDSSYKNQIPAWSDNFHVYKIVWSPTEFQYFIDDVHISTFAAGAGWWYKGGFQGNNIWAQNPMGPFDQEFYIIINNAVGGSTYFADHWDNRMNGQKPWKNDGECRERDFWHGRSQWEPTWNMHNNDKDFVVDFVRVRAL